MAKYLEFPEFKVEFYNQDKLIYHVHDAPVIPSVGETIFIDEQWWRIQQIKWVELTSERARVQIEVVKA